MRLAGEKSLEVLHGQAQLQQVLPEGVGDPQVSQVESRNLDLVLAADPICGDVEGTEIRDGAFAVIMKRETGRKGMPFKIER